MLSSTLCQYKKDSAKVLGFMCSSTRYRIGLFPHAAILVNKGHPTVERHGL